MTLIYRRFIKSSVRVTPNVYAEVGFTSLGPIFNVRMAISAENKGLIIDGLDLTLRYEDGEIRELRWAGIAETFSEITDNSGNKQVVSRDESPIALKIGTESLIEKFVRFQESRYHKADRPSIQNLLAHFNYLKQENPDQYVENTLKSKELFSVLEIRQKSFWWKAGRYIIELKLRSPQKFDLSGSKFYFSLSESDIDLMRKNIKAIETELRNIISSNLPDFQNQPLNWNWASVDIHRCNN